MLLVFSRSRGLAAKTRCRRAMGYHSARGATGVFPGLRNSEKSSSLPSASPTSIAAMTARPGWHALKRDHRAFSTTARALNDSFDPASVERDTDSVDVCIVGGGTYISFRPTYISLLSILRILLRLHCLLIVIQHQVPPDLPRQSS